MGSGLKSALRSEQSSSAVLSAARFCLKHAYKLQTGSPADIEVDLIRRGENAAPINAYIEPAICSRSHLWA